MQADDFGDVGEETLDSIDNGLRREYIQQRILQYFSVQDHWWVYECCEQIAGELYRYYDFQALEVLACAAEQGLFSEFVERLELDCENRLPYDSLNAVARTPTNVREKKYEYLVLCLNELKIRSDSSLL